MSKHIVYWSEDDGSLWLPAHLDEAKPDGSNNVTGYERYELKSDTVTLTLDQIAQGESSIAEVLMRAKVLKRAK